ncbi:hypothetical protein CYMTET_17346, partial [Cymbomonas tetramitiformis]
MDQFPVLDKGLRSPSANKQCETILQFSALIQNNSRDTILLNTALLKLADVFQSANNLSRYCVLSVLLQCGSHIRRVLNGDEFLKRTTFVLASNDPIARALTLRVLGACAVLCSDWLQVHHQVRMALSSKESPEVLAAIFALDRLCALSSRLSQGVLPCIIQLLESMTVQLDARVRLRTHGGALSGPTEALSADPR